MFKRPRTDFWQVGIVPASIERVGGELLGELRSLIVWMPPAGEWRYFADPFALRRNDSLHVFVEAFDYRTKRGAIERHEYRLKDGSWLGGRTVLERPFHLSYPFVFEHQGATFMMPETHEAGEIALYRSEGSLDHWTRGCVLLEGVPAVDASLIQHGGHWWMFYAIVGAGARDRRELHVAHALSLWGPWRPFEGNPVHVDLAGARPAGSPFHGADGIVHLPVQDCSETYGGALRLLRFEELSPRQVSVQSTSMRLTGDLVSDEYVKGFHTLSACGDFTLFDVKRIDRSRVKQWLDLKRRVRRLARRWVPQSA